MRRGETVPINSRDYWVKIVDFLQQNWALADSDDTGPCHVFFVSDTSGVFDTMVFPSDAEAAAALERNGFRQYLGSDHVHALRPPLPPFVRDEHPNGPIYSSGRFWR